MKKSIFYIIYVQPLHRIVGVMIFAIFIWTPLKYIFEKKLQRKELWKLLNGIIATVSVVAIIVVTLSSRGVWTSEVVLRPFYSFVEAQTNSEMYRSMLMNVFLFFPLGLSLPHILPEKWKHQVLWSILFAMFLSTAIEFSQYYYHLGRAEVDDVLCNTVGCAIGCTSYMIYKKLFLLKNMFRKRR